MTVQAAPPPESPPWASSRTATDEPLPVVRLLLRTVSPQDRNRWIEALWMTSIYRQNRKRAIEAGAAEDQQSQQARPHTAMPEAAHWQSGIGDPMLHPSSSSDRPSTAPQLQDEPRSFAGS